jgi:Polyketide cyclase / dehydrase and lipid transport
VAADTTVAAGRAVVVYHWIMTETAIRWPDRYSPQNSPVHVVNKLTMAAPAEVVWEVLVRAADWPSYYANASKVAVEGGGSDLFAGAQFTWKTFGVDLRTQVQEYEPTARIAWLATAPLLEAYHAWLIEPLAGGGCRVITEETQHGLTARAGRLLYPGRMEHWHQKWLEGLAKRVTQLSP